MARLTYYDFDLLIERAQDHYRARVIQSPAGQASAEFTLPFTDQDLEILMLRVGRARRGVRRIESPEMQAAKQFGGKLFEAVFASDVRGALRSSIDAANREGAGLRVRLRLANTPELVDLPWEFLYNSSLNRFLTLSNKTPLVRYIDLPETPRPLKIAPPLRVLVMISSPSDYEPLDVESEWKKLNDALRSLIASGVVKLERLDTPTLGELRRKLRPGEYHVLHFIGHGGFDTNSQDGVLVLQDEQGKGRRTSGQHLATVLTDHDSLRLVVLNACEGGRTARADPFAGVAQSLIQQGIPAVIAMQFEVTDEASITFASEFYAALADGYPVDAALGDARGAIFAQVNDLEWGTPVLYLRAPDGMIFAPLSEQERTELAQARLAQEQERARQEQEQAQLSEDTRAREQAAREREQKIESLYVAAQINFAQNDLDAAEKALAALLALDPLNANAGELQKKIQFARIPSVREKTIQRPPTPDPSRKKVALPTAPASTRGITPGTNLKNWWIIAGAVGLVVLLIWLGLLIVNSMNEAQKNSLAVRNAAETATQQANVSATNIALATAGTLETAAPQPKVNPTLAARQTADSAAVQSAAETKTALNAKQTTDALIAQFAGETVAARSTADALTASTAQPATQTALFQTAIAANRTQVANDFATQTAAVTPTPRPTQILTSTPTQTRVSPLRTASPAPTRLPTQRPTPPTNDLVEMLLISHVPKSFLIDQWPVSIERFEKYVAMTGIVPNARQKGISMIELARAGDPNADVVNITYTEAESYCQWAGKRLPTFEERQSAAYHYQIQQRFGNPYIDEWIEGGWDVYLRGNPNGPELIRYLQRGPDGFASDLSFRCAKDQ